MARMLLELGGVEDGAGDVIQSLRVIESSFTILEVLLQADAESDEGKRETQRT